MLLKVDTPKLNNQTVLRNGSGKRLRKQSHFLFIFYRVVWSDKLIVLEVLQRIS
jgi:hypothetical protein